MIKSMTTEKFAKLKNVTLRILRVEVRGQKDVFFKSKDIQKLTRRLEELKGDTSVEIVDYRFDRIQVKDIQGYCDENHVYSGIDSIKGTYL